MRHCPILLTVGEQTVRPRIADLQLPNRTFETLVALEARPVACCRNALEPPRAVDRARRVTRRPAEA
jgi:hypothetical protein